jgi:hypothetical protein
MSYLLIGDLHLTDRPKDVYRFGIFNWIIKQQDKIKPQATFLMGDITDQKDKHSATLVNKTVDSLLQLRPPVYILMGNHDYISPDNPFFRFLSKLDGLHFISSPRYVFMEIAMIPHCRAEADFAQACHTIKSRPHFLFLHNTFAGAIAETGAPLSGFSPEPIKAIRPRFGCFAGDVHRPQQAGPVTYVGAPYHVRFGDNFEPRCLWVSGTESVQLHFEAPHKWQLTVRDASEILRNDRLVAGDQVKITINVPREEAVTWKTYKKQVLDACKKLELEVFGVDLKVSTTRQRIAKAPVSRQPEDIITAFCKHENAPSQVRQAGLAFVKG